jgi:hypothetical protein
MPEHQEQTDRQRRMAERKEQMRARMPHAETVRIEPASDVLRRAIRHPGGRGFPPTGPAEWPLDKFTKRRIADGSVTVVESKAEAPKPRGRAPDAA